MAKVIPWKSQTKRDGSPKKIGKNGQPQIIPCMFVKTWCPEPYRWLSNRKIKTLSAKGEKCRSIAQFLETETDDQSTLHLV